MENLQQLPLLAESAFAAYTVHAERAKPSITLDDYLTVLMDRKEAIDCINEFCYDFPEWLRVVTQSLQSEIKTKQVLGLAYHKEKEVLENITYFFSKMTYFRHRLEDWAQELDEIKEQIQIITD